MDRVVSESLCEGSNGIDVSSEESRALHDVTDASGFMNFVFTFVSVVRFQHKYYGMNHI